MPPLSSSSPSSSLSCSPSVKMKIRKIMENGSDISSKIRKFLTYMMVEISMLAASYPKTSVVSVLSLTGTLFTVGLLTNFEINVNFEYLMTPSKSQTARNQNMYYNGIDDPDNEYLNRNMSLPAHLLHLHDTGKEIKERSGSFSWGDLPSLLTEINGETDSYNNKNNNNNNNNRFLSIFADGESNQQYYEKFRRNTIEVQLELEVEKGQQKMDKGPAPNNFILLMVIHGNGKNVLTMEGLNHYKKLAYDTIAETKGFHELCNGSWGTRYSSCTLLGMHQLWFDSNNPETASLEPQTNQELLDYVNNASPVFDIPSYFGGIERRDGKVVSAESMSLIGHIGFHDKWEGNNFERRVMNELSLLKEDFISEYKAIDEKDENTVQFTYEGISSMSITHGLINSITNDLPLVLAVFLVMIVFTALVFFQCDLVTSRSLLGFGGVVCIICSIMSGFGIMFIIGAPFTPMTMVVTFLMFGVGLDDKFIFIGAYNRVQVYLDDDDGSEYYNDQITRERIKAMIEDVSISVVATTLATTLSFLLGLTTTIPAIKLVCLYAAPCVVIDLFYELTFFIGLIVLDERRIQSNRADCVFCYNASKIISVSRSHTPDQQEQHQRRNTTIDDNDALSSKVMKWYVNKLMMPSVRLVVLSLFASYFFFALYRLSLMDQRFDATTMLPRSSPFAGYLDAMTKYSTRYAGPEIIFRYVDQKDPKIQDQMVDFIEDMRNIPGMGEDPPLCWVTLYREFIETSIPEELKSQVLQMDMDEQISFGKDMFPEHEGLLSAFEALMEQFTWKNSQGKIVMSQCKIWVNSVDMTNANSQMTLMTNIKIATANHPMNKGLHPDDYPFFSVESAFYPLWELYLKCVPELITTVLLAVFAVLSVSVFIIPHWSGILFLFPTVTILFVDLIGTMQLIGIRVNPISYFALVISIGLMVDYIVHILVRYYESECKKPIERVKDTLETMGVSVFVGGMSTMLGFSPMLFSSSNIFVIIVYTIFPMVVLSLLHGLVFLPILLSLFGPLRIDAEPYSAVSEGTDDDLEVSLRNRKNVSVCLMDSSHRYSGPEVTSGDNFEVLSLQQDNQANDNHSNTKRISFAIYNETNNDEGTLALSPNTPQFDHSVIPSLTSSPQNSVDENNVASLSPPQQNNDGGNSDESSTNDDDRRSSNICGDGDGDGDGDSETDSKKLDNTSEIEDCNDCIQTIPHTELNTCASPSVSPEDGTDDSMLSIQITQQIRPTQEQHDNNSNHIINSDNKDDNRSKILADNTLTLEIDITDNINTTDKNETNTAVEVRHENQLKQTP